MIDSPASTPAVVNDRLAAVIPWRSEVLDGQVTDRHIARLLSESVQVRSLTIEDGARRPDECVTLCGDNLAELTTAEGVPARGEPVRRIRLHAPVVGKDSAAVVTRRDNDSSMRRRQGTVTEHCVVAAYPHGRRCRTSSRERRTRG